jgi:bla regulator protein blaR1
MRLTICAMCLLCFSNGAFGQSTVAPAFEVSSVKPTPPERQNYLREDFCTNGGRFAVAGTPVIWSLAYAYHLKDSQISGAPAWLNEFDSAYDIEARAAGPVNDEQCRLMVQSLFVDRFKLAVHREVKESSVYLLTIGKTGTKLREGGGVKLNGGVQILPSGEPQWPNGLRMSGLTGILSDYTDRPVIDRTGLTGTYGVTLSFSLTDKDDRPSIFTAVQEQLGLKLDGGKAPIEMLVIDHIEKPSEN